MRVLVALGGNAMTGPGGSSHPRHQMAAAVEAAGHIAALLSDGHEVVVTHGNGPQVGDILLQQELAASVLPPVTLDWCGAMTQGSIGFILVNALASALDAAGIERRPVAVVTRTLVDATDPLFAKPSKPIGRHVPRKDAEVMINYGQVWEDRGQRGWRRVVPSPEPLRVIDSEPIQSLVDAGFVVVCNGGGGVPVSADVAGEMRGIEAVIDKDLASVVLARQIDVDTLVIATDVDNAAIAWGTPAQRPINKIAVSELRRLATQGHFASGSMSPKVEAACRFVEAGGQQAVITSMSLIPDALQGRAGTIVVGD